MKKQTTPPPYHPQNGYPPRQTGQQQPAYGPQQAGLQQAAYGPQQAGYGQQPPPYQPQRNPQRPYYQPPEKKKTFWKGCGLGCLISFGIFMVLGIIGLMLEDDKPKDTQSAQNLTSQPSEGSVPRNSSEGERHALAKMDGDSLGRSVKDSAVVDSTGGATMAWEDVYAKQEVSPTPRMWTIDDMPMVHLQDKRQYVSDPDGYMTDWQRARADSFLCMMEHTQDVESAFIVAGHVPEKNAQQFAIDLGKKYGIGTADTQRGVTVCLAVGDKKFFIATTQGVQADLTDLKCGRIGDRYIIPNMKNDNTGAAVMQTCEALYYTLADGDPHLEDARADAQISQLVSPGKKQDTQKEEYNLFHMILGVILLGGIFWLFFHKYIRGSRSVGTSSYSGSYSSSDDDDDDDDYDSSSSYSSSSSSGGSYGGGGSYDGGGSGGGW